jgi:hypothetical protein
MADYPGIAFPKQSSSKRKHDSRLSPEEFRRQVWIREGGRDRCSGQPVSNVATDYDSLGDVCHLKGRRVMPEWLTDPRRAVLMSRSNHILSDARGGYRLKLTDPETGESATDAGIVGEPKPIRFTLHDSKGKVLWSRVR